MLMQLVPFLLIFGKVAKVGDGPEIELDIAENVRIKVIRSMIAEVRSKTEPAKTDAQD